ncbi:MAG: hypothetical protein PHQ52_06545 [Candidatus Omnitrophica bacterium]|nr:hypothetical protein [Candidatus Omnitrophota bacterium]
MRIKLFSKGSLQFRYMMLVVVAMVVPTILVGSFLYYYIFTSTANQIGIPEVIAINLIPVLKRVNLMLVVGLFPMFILIYTWGLILSNRFCGPLRRIEEDVDKILEGNYSIRFRVRERDDIKTVVDKLNALLDTIEHKAK